MTITPEREAELRGLLEKATPGPWSIGGNKHGFIRQYRAPAVYSDGFMVAETLAGLGHVDANAALIVAAVNDLPDLLDLISTEREGRERAEADIQRLKDNYDVVETEVERLRRTEADLLAHGFATGAEAIKYIELAVERGDAAEAQISALQALIAERDAGLIDLMAAIEVIESEGGRKTYRIKTSLPRAYNHARIALNPTEAKTGEPG